MKKILMTFIALFAVAFLSFSAQAIYIPEGECMDFTTEAVNIETGETKTFDTTCLPEGWKVDGMQPRLMMITAEPTLYDEEAEVAITTDTPEAVLYDEETPEIEHTNEEIEVVPISVEDSNEETGFFAKIKNWFKNLFN